jgi:hypothetical protein
MCWEQKEVEDYPATIVKLNSWTKQLNSTHESNIWRINLLIPPFSVPKSQNKAPMLTATDVSIRDE